MARFKDRVSPHADDSLKKTKSITFFLTPSLFKRVSEHCDRNNLYISQFLRRAVEEQLSASTKAAPKPKGFWARLFS